MPERIEKQIGRKGELITFTGPMFARKTGSLIDYVETESYADRCSVVVKPSIDTRYGLDSLVTHSGRKLEAYRVNSDKPEDIITLINSIRSKGETIDIVAIDEAHFFALKEPQRTVSVIQTILESGISVAIAGLPTDFANRGFGAIPELMARADYLEQRVAKCQYRPENNGKRCGARATKSQRLVNGQPARIDDPVVQIGGSEAYEARCLEHHVVED